MNIIGKINGFGTISFHDITQRRMINNHFVGQDSCNVYDEKQNKIVPIEHPNIEQVLNAQYNVSSQYRVEIEADLTDDGRLINFRAV